MNNFTVNVRDRSDDAPVSIPHQLHLTPQWYSSEAIGGPRQAEINVNGPIHALWGLLGWLQHRIEIQNPNSDLVWWGYLEEVTIALGGITVGLSLQDVINRVAVIYTTLGADGTLEQRTTAWATDTECSDAYGVREARVTLADASDAQAEAKRDSILDSLCLPRRILEFGRTETVSAQLRCAGYWKTLGFYYVSNDEGREEHLDGGTDQPLGVGLTASNIGFRTDNKWIFGISGLSAGWTFEITGSSSNNGTYTVSAQTEQSDFDYTATTISFNATDDIADSANGFGGLAVDDVVQVSGSTSNDGIFELSAAAAGSIEVDTSTTTEAAGASVTVERDDYVTVSESLSAEDAGNSITVTVYGEQVAQQFTPTVNANWTVAKIAIRVKKVGSPGDNLTVALHNDSSGSPGTAIESVNTAGSSIATTMGWLEVEFGNTNTINFGTDYWVVVSRSGSNSNSDYYVVDVDEDLGYGGGSFKVYDGSAWQDRPTDADMPFRILGAVETTTQISDMVDDSEFLVGVDIVDTSGIESNQYRDGNTQALDEIIRLLESGTSNGLRMLARVTPDDHFRIYEKPATPTPTADLLMDNDGRLYHKSGREYNVGKLPDGEWVTLTAIPTSEGALTTLSPFLVERAEFQVETMTLTVEPEGSKDIWELSDLELG